MIYEKVLIFLQIKIDNINQIFHNEIIMEQIQQAELDFLTILKIREINYEIS